MKTKEYMIVICIEFLERFKEVDTADVMFFSWFVCTWEWCSPSN